MGFAEGLVGRDDEMIKDVARAGIPQVVEACGSLSSARIPPPPKFSTVGSGSPAWPPSSRSSGQAGLVEADS